MIEPSPPNSGSPRVPWLLRVFAPAAAAEPITDPAQIQPGFAYWRKRVLVSSIAGYAIFYFVRKNLSIAMPAIEHDLGISKSDLGMFLTLHGLLYGVSKFANGFVADRSNARAVMVVGLISSAVLNVFFGLTTAVVMFGLIWMLNGWFQGMGFPPCARLMTHWFAPKQLATKMTIWNTSHSIGAGLVLVLCGYLVEINWRLCFFVPAAIGLCGAAGLWRSVPDTPPSVGLPEVQGTESPKGEAGSEDFKALLWENVFCNKYIWLVAAANFFVYVIRYAILDWGPTMLSQAKHIKLSHAGWMVAAFELSGLAGMLISGWLTDRVFAGRAIRACAVYMIFSAISIVLFWKSSSQSLWVNTALLCGAGFFIYGPQALVGIAAANLATKRAAATAVGLTGLFGYASTVLSGWGLGALVEHHGWNAAFTALTGIAFIGVLLFLLGWRARAHGYQQA
jgi:sugar phosphate permease